MNVDIASRRSVPMYCAAACIALNRISENELGTDVYLDLLHTMQNVIDEYHSTDALVTQCKKETGVDIIVSKKYED